METAADLTIPAAEPPLYTAVHEKTAALTEEIAKVEKEIDDRVPGLYGLEQEVAMTEEALQMAYHHFGQQGISHDTRARSSRQDSG